MNTTHKLNGVRDKGLKIQVEARQLHLYNDEYSVVV